MNIKPLIESMYAHKENGPNTITFTNFLNALHLQPKTQLNYVNAVQQLEKGKFSNVSKIPNTVKDFREMLSKLEVTKEYKDANSSGKNMYSAAYRHYLDYLIFIEMNEVEQVVQDLDLNHSYTDSPDLQTETVRFVTRRISQSLFRKRVMLVWNGSCAISGIKKPDLLIASHIKPWSCSSNMERIDPFNGIMLVSNYDSLFDRGYITFKDDGFIKISKRLTAQERLKLNIDKNIQIQLHEEHKKYLHFHRECCFN